MLALLLGVSSGCTYTVAGSATPTPGEPPQAASAPTLEFTVAEFTYVLGGGDMAPRIFDGALLSQEIMKAWQERGYVRMQDYVEEGAFSGTADYHLTLRGSQRGDTSFTMQVINALTLSLVPYTITERYYFEYVLEDVRRGTHYTANVQASEKTWIQPLLVFALPVADRGHRTTMQRVGDSLYEQFALQGAFAEEGRAAVESAAHP